MKRKSRKKKIKVVLLVLTAAVLFAGVCLLSVLIFRRSDLIFHSKQVDAAINEVFKKNGIDASCVRKTYVRRTQGNREWNQVKIAATLNQKISLRDTSIRLRKALDLSAVTVKEIKLPNDAEYERLQLSVFTRGVPIYQIQLKKKVIAKQAKAKEYSPPDIREKVAVSVKGGAPKIALIIDDVGYDVERALELMELRQPMTISIFPRLRNSRRLAEAAHQMGYEVMLHLPMEADGHLKQNPGHIMESMGRDEIFDVLNRDLESISHVSGVNNHQGSKMTKERDAMTLVMEHLAEKELYFIDSRTTRESVAYAVARECGLKAAENDFFLDNEKDPEYIRQRLLLLADEARKKGAAVGICHVNSVTIQTLKQMIPVLEQEGIRFVYASQVVE